MFKQDSVNRAAPWLSIAAISVIFLGIISVTNAFLNSAGKQNLPIISMLCGAGVKMIANYVLLGKIGIAGAPIGTVLCYVTASSLNAFFVVKNVGALPNAPAFFIRPIACSAVSVGVAALFYYFASSIIPHKICTVISIIIASMLYAVTVIKSKTVGREEINMLPHGEKVCLILEKMKILSE